MSGFDQLAPALQHHIVNSLGWRELRPFQDAVIPELLSGRHLIVLAPTAGGKTEAAFFPALSRMLDEGWTGLSVLYVCPLKALLNNLDQRLQRYCRLVGRRSALWHGDVKPAERKRIQRDPPDCLLTTPESLEVMLVSASIDARALLGELRLVIVDEVHAFAGDDRGWHLLALLERVSRLAGREIQRVGLSATVGNPELLVDWLAGGTQGPRGVCRPPAPPEAVASVTAGATDADVAIDFVGTLSNAAVVINRLHRGEKRLAFVDSRARAEQLAAELRGLGTAAVVTHSSLSHEQRRQAEETFAGGSDCVIVATSALELGIDVGDLDRVIQIDAPRTVASFLQRMGRTGRRRGTQRNCLFLATKEETLVQAAALVALWEEGFVEPIIPPPLPWHILAQQLMALALQERGIGRDEWFAWIAGVRGFAELPAAEREALVGWMLERDILWDDEGLLWLGRRGERDYGRRNFLELFSVFLAPPMFAVLEGRRELGFVDESGLLAETKGPRTLLLGGRSWRVTHIEWQRRVAYVEATDERGAARWRGGGQGLSFALGQSIRRVLASDVVSERWSQRASDKLRELRQEYAWLPAEGLALRRDAEGRVTWHTFGGQGANAVLATALAELLKSDVDPSDLAIEFKPEVSLDAAEGAIGRLGQVELAQCLPVIDAEATEGLKFVACLPPELAERTLALRLADLEGARACARAALRVVVG